MSFVLTNLEAVEPDKLADAPGIDLIVDASDFTGFSRVQVTAPTREALVDYVRSEWGDEDDAWFHDVVAGIFEAPDGA